MSPRTWLSIFPIKYKDFKNIWSFKFCQVLKSMINIIACCLQLHKFFLSVWKGKGFYKTYGCYMKNVNQYFFDHEFLL